MSQISQQHQQQNSFVVYISNLNLKLKVLGLILLVAVACVLLISILSFYRSKNTLYDFSSDQLTTMRSISKKQLEKYFQNSKTFTLRLANDRLIETLTLSAQRAYLNSGFGIFKDNDVRNDNYVKTENLYAEKTSSLINDYQFENFYLAGTNGAIVYGAKKMSQDNFLGRSLLHGAYKKTKLAGCFKAALESKKAGEVAFSDYEYFPETGKTMAFLCTKKIAELDNMSSGVFVGDVCGVIIAQLDLDFANTILLAREGMGQSGQAYIVGDDKKLRSNFFVNKEKFNINEAFEKGMLVDSDTIKMALKGKEGSDTNDNPNHRFVMASYSPIEAFGRHWAIVAEKEMKEIMSPIYEMMLYIVIFAFLIFAAVFILGRWGAGTITGPIIRSSERLVEMENEVGGISSVLSKTSGELSTAASKQSAAAQESVAAMEEMRSMINKNHEYATSSLTNTKAVSNKVGEGNDAINDLFSSMNHIEEVSTSLQIVIDIINNISQKTEMINEVVTKSQLLSFNASIEAARAGSHGKGFAVVAEEMGNLAGLSGAAAQEINSQLQEGQLKIGQIVESVQDTVRSGKGVVNNVITIFKDIAHRVGDVDQQIQGVAVASNEQKIGVEQTFIALKELDKVAHKNNGIADSSLQNAKTLNGMHGKMQNITKDLKHLVFGGDAT